MLDIDKVSQVIDFDRFISVICFTPKRKERSPDVERILQAFVLVMS